MEGNQLIKDCRIKQNSTFSRNEMKKNIKNNKDHNMNNVTFELMLISSSITSTLSTNMIK